MSVPGLRDTVRLNVPENPRLHRQVAHITQLFPWGAYLYCEAAASKEFRALWHEMDKVENVSQSAQMQSVVQPQSPSHSVAQTTNNGAHPTTVATNTIQPNHA